LKDRPEVLRLLEDVKGGKINNVLVYKIDRLTRSTKNLIELIDLFVETGCAFNSLMESIDTSTATGRMFIKIVGIFAEFERENLAERVSFGIEQKAREGNYINCGGVYGYDYDKAVGDIVFNKDEAEMVKKIYEMYLKGTSFSLICKWLTERNVPTKRGGRWDPSTIESILSNPLYIGKIRYGLFNQKESFVVDDTRYPLVVDEDTFSRVQAIIQNRRKYTQRQYPGENTYFLSFLICDDCGRRLTTNQHVDARSNNKRLNVNYVCSSRRHGECSCRGFSQNKMEKAFQDYFNGLNDFSEEESAAVENIPPKEDDERASLEKKLAQNSKRLEDVRLLFTQDKLSFEEYREFSGTLSMQAAQLQEDLAKLTPASCDDAEIDLIAIQGIITNLRANWVNLTNAEKKEFLMMFVESIHVRNEVGLVTITDVKFNNSKAKNQDKPKTKKKRLTGIG